MTCPKCGAETARKPFESFIRCIYECANGHVIVTLVNPLRGIEEVLLVEDA